MALVSFELNDKLLDKVKQKLPNVREWPHDYCQVDIRNPLFISKSSYIPKDDNRIECSRFLTLMFRKVTTSVCVNWELIEDKRKELIE